MQPFPKFQPFQPTNMKVQPLPVGMTMDMKVTVVHKTYREHYVLFQGHIPKSLSELLTETKKLMVRSNSPILDLFDESYSAGSWMGRISWIEKDGDEIPLLDDADYHCFHRSWRSVEMRNIIIRVVSPKPEPDETMKLQPIEYVLDSSVRVASSVASGNAEPDQQLLPLHKNILCDVCDTEIRGHRYKCMTCQNYDLCSSCEGKYRHKEHMMLRIPTPDIRCHSAYGVFDKLRQFAMKMTPLVTGDQSSYSPHPGKSSSQRKNNGCHKLSMRQGTKPMKLAIVDGCLKFEPVNEVAENPGTAKPSKSSAEEKSNPFAAGSLVIGADLIEALTAVATVKQELKSNTGTTTGNGNANEAEKKDDDKRDASVEDSDSTDELWTVLDGQGSTIPEEVLLKLDSPGTSFEASPVKKAEPTAPPKETDGNNTPPPPNRAQPDVKSKMNQLSELVTAAVLEGTRLMSVPAPEQRPVPPPTIQDDHDEKAARVDDAAAASAKASSGASSATAAAATASSSPSSKPDPNKVYSELPHVNHAIHTLITMGFSNDNGWLTRLLESLDGDIPKALDLLLLQPSNTNNSPPRS